MPDSNNVLKTLCSSECTMLYIRIVMSKTQNDVLLEGTILNLEPLIALTSVTCEGSTAPTGGLFS